MVSRRLAKRIEHEASEKLVKPAKKKAVKKKAVTRKRKVKAPERKKIYWGVFSGTLKEEGRFAYDEKDKAEEKLELLRSKGKKLYFIQPIKEVLSDSPGAKDDSAPADEEEDEVIVRSRKGDDDEDMDDDDDDSDDEEE